MNKTVDKVLTSLEYCISDKCSEECPYRGKRYGCVYQHRHEKDLLDLIKRQKAEIERLTELQKDSCLRAVELALENAELQKQVDELTAFKNEAISLSIYGKGRKDGEEVAVKETAKKFEKKLKYEVDFIPNHLFCVYEVKDAITKVAKEITEGKV